ncbi:MAG: hypothetical protein IIB62_09600, partial [Proteobacteria bacterium]|nr:hypothetical protein [Pseudomonadota bacterium]
MSRHQENAQTAMTAGNVRPVLRPARLLGSASALAIAAVGAGFILAAPTTAYTFGACLIDADNTGDGTLGAGDTVNSSSALGDALACGNNNDANFSLGVAVGVNNNINVGGATAVGNSNTVGAGSIRSSAIGNFNVIGNSSIDALAIVS